MVFNVNVPCNEQIIEFIDIEGSDCFFFFFPLSFIIFLGFWWFILFVSGKVVIHALDEKAREYYKLEDLWTTEPSEKDPMQVNIDALTNKPYWMSIFCLLSF